MRSRILLASLVLATPAHAQDKVPASEDSAAVPERPGTASQGIQITGPCGVSDDAFERARYVVDTMLSSLPEVRDRMTSVGFKVDVIPKDRVLTDLPDYASLKGMRTADGRDYDKGTRGLGGDVICSVGEENLLCLEDQRYKFEDIMVHEFAHSIKSHLGSERSRAIDAAYDAAMKEGLYPREAYMARNSQEYWAEGTQAWFEVTGRQDVNGGFNTQQKIKNHDPRLAAILDRVYGSTRISRYRDCGY